MDSEDENNQENEHDSELDDEDMSDNGNKDDSYPGDEPTSESGRDKKRKHKREKGPPIVCLMCKTVWTKNRRGGRLFMFGGTRPFMAKFEAKMKALMGLEDLTALQNRSATKFGRSYICRECYLMVRQTYDNIRRIQRNVAKSIWKMKSLKSSDSLSLKEDVSDSDQDLEIDYQAHNTPKKKLPPVAERIAEKIAGLTLVKINSKVPRIVLQRVNVEADDGHNENDESDETNEDDSSEAETSNMYISEQDDRSNSCEKTRQSYRTTDHNLDETRRKQINGQEENESVGFTEIANQNSHPFSQQTTLHTDDEHAVRLQADNLYSSREAAECSAISLNVDTSFASQHSVSQSSAVELPSVVTDVKSSLATEAEGTSIMPENHDTNSLDSLPSNKPSPAELAEILSNPLLLVKTPQPIKLAEVKHEKVYICGEGGCDWIFSSRFFWENHIRHYHRSGKPFICPFEGCDRSFTGKSKLELHVRSHTDERPFICDKCGSGFRGNQELRAHRLTHTSEKPHQCPKCDKNFKLLSSLKRHLQFHDGGNFPYPCTYPECEKAFKSRYDLKCHYRLHTGEKPYKCPEPGCGMAFRIPCQFTMHKRSHSGERPFRCTEDGCSAAYISSNALQAHMLTHTSERPFCCEFCGKTFKNKMLYRMHLKKHSGPQGFVCPIEDCGEEYAERRLMDQHMAVSHGIQDYKPQNKKFFICPEEGCGLKYCTDNGLRYHRLRVHKQGNVPCEEEPDSRKLICPYDKCEREYEESNDLRDHLAKVHMSIPREKMCPLCGLAFPHMDQLELHIHSFHNEASILNEHLKGIFVCNSERCGLRFHRLEELKHHVNWHLGNPPYRCEFEECGRSFLLESMYSNHVMEHENLKPFTCSFDHCQEGFTSHIKVLKHSKMHYGLFRCPIDGCSKAMQTLSTARLHLQRHEKPYVCMLCGKRFRSSTQWMKHKRSHTGEKLYECKVCSSQFPDSESLKTHKRIHKGEKRYMCEECGQRFSSQVSRKNHMKTHSRELPFVCPEEGCGKAFRESGSLKAHQNVHSKPSHLCTQCGKVYKFSVSKHRCKTEPEEQGASAQHVEYMQQPESVPMQEQKSGISREAPPPLPPPPQSLLQPVPQPIPQNIPQSIPQSIAQPTSQSMPQSINQPLPHSISQTLVQTIPQPIVQTIAQPIPQSIPQSVTQTIPLSLSQSMPQTMPHAIVQTIPQPIVQTLPHPMPQSMPQPISQSISHSIPQSLPPSLSQSLSQSIPQALPQSLPQTLSQPIPQQPPPQQYMNNVMMSEPPPQSYVMEVEEAARAMRQNFGAPDTIVVDPPYYNYIILYDRPVQQ